MGSQRTEVKPTGNTDNPPTEGNLARTDNRVKHQGQGGHKIWK